MDVKRMPWVRESSFGCKQVMVAWPASLELRGPGFLATIIMITMITMKTSTTTTILYYHDCYSCYCYHYFYHPPNLNHKP